MSESDDRLARLEVLLTEMDRRIELRFEQLEKRLVEGFAAVNARIDGVEGRIGSLEARIGSFENQIPTRLLAIEGRLTLLESHKADKSTLNLWGMTLAAPIGAGVALVKLWP